MPYAKERSIHFSADSPSFINIINNRLAPIGMAEATHLLLFEQMNQWPAIHYIAKGRTQDKLDSDSPACTFFKVKTPQREKHYIFSLPTDVFLGVRLYQHKSSTPIPTAYLNDEGAVSSLTSYFNHFSEHSLLLIADHQYGGELDHELRALRQANWYRLEGIDPYLTFMQMFLKRRVDFTFVYPASLVTFPDISQQLRSYAVEGVPDFVSSHIMCNNTPETHRFLARVNEALQRLYSSQAFMQALLDFTPISEHDFIKRLVTSRRFLLGE